MSDQLTQGIIQSGLENSEDGDCSLSGQLAPLLDFHNLGTVIVVDGIISCDVQVYSSWCAGSCEQHTILAHPWTVIKCYSALLGGHSTWYFGPIQF